MNNESSFLNRLERNNWLVFLILLGVAFVLRFHTFIPYTLDRDEATYAVFADHLINHGSDLYKDVQDIKQPGIFLIFSALQLVAGKSIIAIRFTSILVISSATFFLYLFKRREGFDLIPSLLTGFIFILMFNYFFGLSANTELFFIWCFALGLMIFQRASSLWWYLLSGLTIGFGFIVKQHVIFDFAALGLFFFISSGRNKKLMQNLPAMILMLLGFATPYLLTHLYFYVNGNWEHYKYITYIVPNNYLATRDWSETLQFNLIALLIYSPFVAMAIISWRLPDLSRSFKLLILLLLCFDLLAINLTGKPFKHYLLQFAVPLSLIAGEVYHQPFFRRIIESRFNQRLAIGLCILYAVILSVVYQSYRFDSARELISFFENRIKEKDTIYAADSPTILYWFFDKKSPTKYIHSTLMVFPHHVRELEIDVKSELDRILNKEPTYIVISDRYPYKWFREEVAVAYKLVGDLEKYTVYQSLETHKISP